MNALITFEIYYKEDYIGHLQSRVYRNTFFRGEKQNAKQRISQRQTQYAINPTYKQNWWRDHILVFLTINN